MGNNNSYYSKSQTDKIGNAIIYLSTNYNGKLYKTTLLKLIYLLEESSIKKFGVPFFGIDFKIWKFGPVFTDLYYELNEGLEIFEPYFDVSVSELGKFVHSNVEFSDDEFSDNDMELMDTILESHKGDFSEDLVQITHSKNRPWYIQASNDGLLDEKGELITSITDTSIDFEILLDKESTQYYLLKSALESKRVFDSLV